MLKLFIQLNYRHLYTLSTTPTTNTTIIIINYFIKKATRRLSTLKIICNQKLLANKIGIVQKAINSKTTLDLLKGVLIVTKQDEIVLKGYD